MNFTDIFIRRPVFAMALSLMLIVVGIAAFVKMPIRQYPLIEENVINVSTIYPGASGTIMAGFVTTPLENAIGSVEGIDYMTSSSSESTSTITVNLLLGYSMETAMTDVVNAVQSTIWQLPKDVQTPNISKTDPNAEPVDYIAFNSKTLSAAAVTDYILRAVQPVLDTLDGVSQTIIYGEREYAMRLNLDPLKMAAYGITAGDVFRILQNQNLQAAVGTVYSKYQQFDVTINSDMSTVDEFNNMVLKQSNGTIVRLRDVGTAVLGANNYNSSAVVDGKETTVIGVVPTSDANPLAVSQEVQAVLPTIQAAFPKGLSQEIVYDSSVFISASIHEVVMTIIEASIFVILVICLFLGSIRSVFIPIVTIPVSIIGVCGIMMALNYTIDTISLLAWVIAIGLVVDDAIVVLENIYRHMEDGLQPVPASIVGAREIGFAIIAMTLTLAAVYAPLGFTGGLTGILFTEFAFTLAGAVIVSGFVALTLSPMMCSRILSYDDNPNSFTHKIDRVFEKVIVKYKSILRRVMEKRWYVVAVAAALYIVCGYLFTHTKGELAPLEDQGYLFGYIIGPSSANVNFTQKYTDQMVPIYNALPEMSHNLIINGFGGVPSQAASVLNLVNWDKRSRTASQIQASLLPKFWAIPGLKIFPINPQPLPSTGGFIPVEFVLKTTNDIKTLLPAIQQLQMAAAKNPGFTNLTTDLMYDRPRIKLDIDRNKAGDLGIPIADITNTLGTMFGSPESVQFSIQDRAYYVIPEYTKNFNFAAEPTDMNKIYLRTQSGAMVPLSTVVKVEQDVEPLAINHFQQLNSATLQANLNLATGYTLGQAIDFLTNYTKQYLPDVQFDYAGQARQYIEASSAFVEVFAFAVIFIFLLLSAQFESFRDPLIILAVAPLTLAGALITTHLTGGTLNIYTKIGLTTLIGLIAKHGILIVEFANQLQEKGVNKHEAAIEATAMRLRPILMTTAAMVLGALPLALASGAGAAARHAIGWVIVGGMTIGTMFSLFVVPTFYSLFAKVKVFDVELEKQISAAIKKSEALREEEEKRRRGE
ncbi:MAG: efflux RND transporter permease subunit [Gammaproteobacteria bacterium]|nr:efflux RND transporter permease subunit [Gammaproteobacteria bacterium]